MAQLTRTSRVLLTLATVVGIGLAVKTWVLPKFGNGNVANTEQTATNGQPDGNGNGNGNTSESKVGATWTPQPFNYSPAEPINGTLKGVAELGATGFNYFVVRIDGQKNWKLESSKFGVSLVKEGMATDQDIKDGLKTYISEMAGLGVNPKNIHFVVSSGAMKEPGTINIIRVLKVMKYYVNTVTPQQEAQLAWQAAVPREFRNNSFCVDIGSSNTKIAWSEGWGLPKAVELPGAKYYQGDNPPSDALVYHETADKSRLLGENLRGRCFIIGGVPFDLAKSHRQGKERYTTLKAPGDYSADGAKQKSGLNIYKAVADATGCQQFVFDWDANFTIGFLLGLK